MQIGDRKYYIFILMYYKHMYYYLLTDKVGFFFRGF